MTTSAMVNSAITDCAPSGSGNSQSCCTGLSSWYCSSPSLKRTRRPARRSWDTCASSTGPWCRVPTGQAVRDVRLVSAGPVAHGRRDEQVAESAEEGHRRYYGNAGHLRGLRVGGEHCGVRLDLRGDIDVRDPRAQGRLDHWPGGHRERARQLLMTAAAPCQRPVQGRRIVHRCRPHLDPSPPWPVLRAAPRHGPERIGVKPRSMQFRDDEASRCARSPRRPRLFSLSPCVAVWPLNWSLPGVSGTPVMRTLSDMHTVALATAGHLLHFELAVAYEIFRTPPDDVAPDDWYDVRLCGPGPTQIGPFMVEPEHGLDHLATADTVLVPACADVDVPPPAELVEAIRAAHDAGARIASLCTGAFALGAAGLLDGRLATTHWAHTAELSARHPRRHRRPRRPLHRQRQRAHCSGQSSRGRPLHPPDPPGPRRHHRQHRRPPPSHATRTAPAARHSSSPLPCRSPATTYWPACSPGPRNA